MSVPWNQLMHSPLRQCLASQFIWIKPWIRSSNCCSKRMAIVHAGMHRINQCPTDLCTSLVDATVRRARYARRTYAFKCILLALNIYKWNKIKLKLSSVTAIVCAFRSNELAARRTREPETNPVKVRCRSFCTRRMTLGGTIVNEMLLFHYISSNLRSVRSFTITTTPKSAIKCELKSNADTTREFLLKFHINRSVSFDFCATD